jgi:hypothetical protein
MDQRRGDLVKKKTFDAVAFMRKCREELLEMNP